MIKLSEPGEAFKIVLERLLPLAEADEQIYIESVQLCATYIGMIVAKVVRTDRAIDVLYLVFSQIENSEKEHRLNLEDVRRMMNNTEPKL